MCNSKCILSVESGHPDSNLNLALPVLWCAPLLCRLSYVLITFLKNSPSASLRRICYSEMLPAAWRPTISHAVSLIQFRPDSATGKFFPPLLRKTTAYRRNLNDTRAIDRSASISIALSIVFGSYSPTGNRYCLWQFKNNISDNPFSDRPQLYGMPRPIRFIGTAKPSAWPDMLFYEFHRFKFLEGKPSKCESENSPCKDQHVLFPWYSNDTPYYATDPCYKWTDRTCKNAFQNRDPDYVRRQCPGIKGAACCNDRLNEQHPSANINPADDSNNGNKHCNNFSHVILPSPYWFPGSIQKAIVCMCQTQSNHVFAAIKASRHPNPIRPSRALSVLAKKKRTRIRMMSNVVIIDFAITIMWTPFCFIFGRAAQLGPVGVPVQTPSGILSDPLETSFFSRTFVRVAK